MANDSVDKLVVFLAKRDGIDKLVKTFQYVSKLAHYRTDAPARWPARRAKRDLARSPRLQARQGERRANWWRDLVYRRSADIEPNPVCCHPVFLGISGCAVGAARVCTGRLALGCNGSVRIEVYKEVTYLPIV
ncbi:uncharacterized protein LOC109839432 [Asparagus officinalis]|uniref:uncharacterized protein LOC109839432 n=1 Tax=Asparagus officinalis TaxID=4686 RepID=UPI00098E03E7|nr:uncharacterized protein LOC109839432 [Asparagus officinalis]